MTNDYDYIIQLNVPQSKPTAQEVELYTSSVEPFLQKLLDAEHLTKEELAAYIKFMLEFAQFNVFMMDEFLNYYRQATNPPATSSLVLPG